MRPQYSELDSVEMDFYEVQTRLMEEVEAFNLEFYACRYNDLFISYDQEGAVYIEPVGKKDNSQDIIIETDMYVSEISDLEECWNKQIKPHLV